ncbi:hypothetical protein CYY_002790 [Polysphondylium violaceum]|uniref:DNA-dependent protein kinase catalytic subunit n=1 Tax=Polysphondylium violaceum TaxID=133409 RepID=A0A8J4V9A5_9MYCE|nr:hypothetical protein CYY_002790 [Polysphondylium violaceum]
MNNNNSNNSNNEQVTTKLNIVNNGIYQKLSNYLRKLYDIVDKFVNNKNASNSLESDSVIIIEELKNVLLKELVMEEEIALASSLLFSGDHSILKLIEKTITLNSKEVVKVKTTLLSLISEFIVILQKRTENYALAIKNLCISVFRRDQSASVQAMAFAPIKKILHMIPHYLKNIRAEVFGVREMSDLLLLQFTCGKFSQTVRGEIVVTLGLFTEIFPTHMSEKNNQICALLMETLGAQLKSKAPETYLIVCCLKGLDSLLFHFSGDFVAVPKNVQMLYQYIYLCMDPVSSATRYEVPRAAMKIILHHSLLFKQYLTEQAENFYTRIEHWCNHVNKPNRDIAFNTVDVFFSQIAKELISGNRSFENDQSTFKFFIRKFYSIFENNTSSRYELSIAIRGCGRFASPVKSFMGEWELKSLLSSLFKFSEKLMIVKIDNIDEITLHLSSFINAFASILYELNELEFWYLDQIEQVLETYFIIYPHLFVKSHHRFHMAVNRLISSMYFRGEYLKILLSRIVKKGLLISFSKANKSVLGLITTGDTPFYQVYKEVWYHLLNPSIDLGDIPEAFRLKSNIQQEVNTSIRKLIYDEMISSILSLIDKLDLQYSSKEELNNNNNKNNNNSQKDKDLIDQLEEEEEDENNATIKTIEFESEFDQLIPKTPKDIELFLNLVEFFKLFFTTNHTELFVQWIYIIGKDMIFNSKRYPLISGFYKMIQVVMEVTKKESYFYSIQDNEKDLDENNNTADTMITTTCEEDENKKNCFILFGKFIKEVVNNVSHFKDELLSSCLELLLSLPKQLINVSQLVPIVCLAFQYGLGYLKLGHVGLNAIEYWLKVVPQQVHNNLHLILPHLNDYLLMSSAAVSNSSGEGSSTSISIAFSEEKLSVGGFNRKKKFKSNSIDPKLLQFKTSVEDIQNRIIRLLGKLGGDNSFFLGDVNLLASGTETGVAWDTEQKLSFEFPFIDQKANIFLDSILPGVLSLAEKCTIRQTKVAACEFLHSILLFMIGKSSTASEEVSFSRLYKKIFPGLLKLSTDVEQVTKQLFQPLVFQIIHWFTRNKRQESDDTMTLLNAIIDAVGHPLDGALREFAGKCLSEFTKWSLKNTSQKQQEKNPFNFKSILKRIYSLAHHPNSHKRLGAAISLNELYRVFREEDILVNHFIFEIMHNILFSLRIGDDNADDSIEIASKFSNVLVALTKVIQRKADLLNNPDTSRREHKDLSDFVSWVMKDCCSRPENIARYESMQLFIQLVVLLPGIKTPIQWIKKQQPLDQYLISIAESQAVWKIPRVDTANSTSSSAKANLAIKEIEFWYKRLSTSLNVYLWYFGQGFLDPQMIIGSSTSKILTTAFHIFPNEFALLETDKLSLFSSMTLSELEHYNRLKCSVIMNLFGLFILLMEKHNVEQVMSYGGISFIHLLVLSMMDPKKLGFDTISPDNMIIGQESKSSEDVSDQSKQEISNLLGRQFKFPPLSEITARIIKILIENGGAKYKDTIYQVVREYILLDQYNLLQIDKLLAQQGSDRIIQLIHCYKNLYTNGMLDTLLLEISNSTAQTAQSTLISKCTNSQSFANLMLEYLFEHSTKLSPSRLLVFKQLLELVFTIGISSDKLLSYIIDPTVKDKKDKKDDNNNNSDKMDTDDKPEPPKDSRYDIFYKYYIIEINTFVSNHFESFLTLLANIVIQTNSIHKILNDICILKQSLSSQKLINPKKEILSIIGFLEKIKQWSLSNNLKIVEKENIVEFTKNLIKIEPIVFFETKQGYDYVYSIVTNYLTRSNPLSFKNKVLELLPYLLSCHKHLDYSIIKEKLNEIVVYDFPLNSKDLTQRSPIYNEYVTTIERFLETLEITKNPFMIDVLLHVLKETDHSHIQFINLSIQKIISSTNDQQAKDLFSHCFQIFLSQDYQDELKITLIDKFCVPLIHHMKETVLVQLFCQNLTSFMSIIQPLTPKYLSDSQERKSSIIEKICCFRLVEALYQSLSSTIIKDTVNPYFYDKPDAKGTELTAAIMKAAHSAKSEKLTSDDKFVTRQLCTLYHSAAYCALASVILCTQTKENFFHVFFFKENKDKNEYLWENIVNTELEYKFEPETNFIINYNSPQSLFSNDLRYLSSQYLVDSSLSQDFISKSFIEDEDKVVDSNNILIGQKNNSITVNEIDTDIEIDQINSNPSMIALLKIIDYYQLKFVSTTPTIGEPQLSDMPKWMTEIYNKINDSDLHPNIIIFMIKIIINRPQYFERFYKYWVPILLDYVVSKNTGGSGFHYFIRDVCLILLSWPNLYSVSDKLPVAFSTKQLISKFINYLFKNCYCSDRRILKSNLTIIKQFTENWKGLFTIDQSTIVEYLVQKGDYKSKSRQIKTTGLVLLSIMLCNGIPAFDASNHGTGGQSEFKFYQILLDNLQDFKELYDATSEVCGMILLYNSKHQIQSNTFQQMLKDKINTLLANNDYQRVFSCLYFIALHYPGFVASFYSKIFNLLPQLTNDIRSMALNIISWCSNDIPDLFQKLKSCNLDNLIHIRDGDTQLVLLQILNKILTNPTVDSSQKQQLVNLLKEQHGLLTSSTTNEHCRLLYYEMIMYIYHQNFNDADQDRDIILCLLIGLSDESEMIGKKLFEFWDNVNSSNPSTIARIIQLFTTMYAPETEGKWLSNSCCLLLSICNKSPDFSKLLFEKPLSECTFKEVVLDSSWQNRTSNMNPLFSSSQYGLDGESSQISSSMMMDQDEIRATQTPQFTLTQTAFREFYPSSNSQSVDSDVTMSVSSSSSQGSQRSNSNGKKKQLNVVASGDLRSNTYNQLRKRFKKVDERVQDGRIAGFARLQVMRNKERESFLEKSKQARENKITMIRKYRSGELPDIQIKSQDVLKPLLILCQKDSNIGVYIFSSLFTTIYKNSKQQQQKDEIKQAIFEIVDKCRFNTSLVSCLLNIFEKNLDLSPTYGQITNIALKSNNHPMAIILIEKLLNIVLNNNNKKKTTPDDNRVIDDAWNSLRELYRALKEEDIILGILEKQSSTSEYTKKALEFELKGDWIQMLKTYDEATLKLEEGAITNITDAETNLWENGRLDCLTKLRNWTHLRDNFNAYYPNPMTIFEDYNQRETLFHYFLQYHLKVKENWPSLYQFISSLNLEQYQFLETKFPGELAFLEITRSDHNKAQYYIQKFYQTFKEQWASSHPLAIASRHKILQPIQKIVEIEEFLSLSLFSINSDVTINTNQLNSLLKQWKHRYPSLMDDIEVWDDIVSFRSVLLEKIYERFTTSFANIESKNQDQESIVNKVKSTLIQERAELYHKMSKGARKLGNVVVSESYFRLSVKSYPKTKDNDLAFPLVSSLLNIYCMKAKNSPSPMETLDRFVKALKFIDSKKDDETIASSKQNLQKYLMMNGDILWELYQLDRKLGSELVSDSIKKNQIGGSLSSTSVNRLRDELFSLTFKSFSESISLSNENKKDQHVDKKHKSANLKFANFCDNVLRDKQSTQSNSIFSVDSENIQLAKSTIRSTLEAIREEIPGAIDKFPRLLELLQQFDKSLEIITEFKELISTIPSWMFIRWISQMFPYLELPQGPLVLPILLEIAKYYPQAIYFPYKISSEQFTPVALKLSLPLSNLLQHPLLDSLIQEFLRLTHPEHRFKDYMEEMKALLKMAPINSQLICKLGTEIYNDCFNQKTVKGEYNLKFAKEWEAKFIQHFGADGSKTLKMDVKKLVEVVGEMSANMNKAMKPTSTASMKLKDFSFRLAEFDKSNFSSSQEMEIPGQYSGVGKPQPDTHIKISSFDTNILVMGSLRKPKRIKIHGNDEKDYPFLIKGGEDLRLDQRIQQLFRVMNEILGRDTAASKRGLRVTTYQVVPMTSKVGIIEWINDTKPLREILEEQLAIQTKMPRSQVSISRLESTKIHNDWIQEFSKYLKGGAAAGPLYQQMFIHANRDNAVKKLDRQHARIPADLLQKGIWALSSSPESYLFIRNSFARSLAAFSICSYIIGIGDRHLENFLISQKDGRLIGIDFGHAFGTATQFLPIPELMPFRLTRQFTSFLAPLESVGLLNHSMTYTLGALESNKDILLSTMDVFVKEPLLDWSKLANRLVKEQGKHPKDTKNEWFPKQKVALAKKKLEMYNPAYITLEELAGSVHNGLAYDSALQLITKGDIKYNIRAKVNKVCSSVKEQVDCLIDQASDPNILSRTWVGWNGAL